VAGRRGGGRRLHRAVSLARSALQQGGMAQAIRTQRGWAIASARTSRKWFCPMPEDHRRARAGSTCLRRIDWMEPGGVRRGRRRESARGGRPRTMATACQYSGACRSPRRARARGRRACERGRSPGRRTRGALDRESRAGGSQGGGGEGWRNRAATYLASEHECREHGFLAWITSRIAIFAARWKVPSSRPRSRSRSAGGSRSGARSSGLNYQALAHLALGDVAHGVPFRTRRRQPSLGAGRAVGGRHDLLRGHLGVREPRRLATRQPMDRQFQPLVERQGVAPFPASAGCTARRS